MPAALSSSTRTSARTTPMRAASRAASELAHHAAGQGEHHAQTSQTRRHLLLQHQEGDKHQESVLYRDVEKRDQREGGEPARMADAPIGATHRALPLGAPTDPGGVQEQEQAGPRGERDRAVAERHPPASPHRRRGGPSPAR